MSMRDNTYINIEATGREKSATQMGGQCEEERQNSRICKLREGVCTGKKRRGSQ